MSFFVASEVSAQNVSRDTQDLIISEDSETRDNLGGTFLGRNAGKANQGEFVTAMGFETLYTNQGNYNTALGYLAGNINSFGSSNCFIGAQTGINNTTGHNNIFLGTDTGFENQNGFMNIFMGTRTAQKNIKDGYNVIIGHFSAQSNVRLENTIAFGHENVCSRTDDILFGNFIHSTGSSNIIIGHDAKMTATNEHQHNIIFGHHLHLDHPFYNCLLINTQDDNTFNASNVITDRDALFFNKTLTHSPTYTKINTDNFSVFNSNAEISFNKFDKEATFLLRYNENKTGYAFERDKIHYYGTNIFHNDIFVEGRLAAEDIQFNKDLFIAGDLDVFENIHGRHDISISNNANIQGNLDVQNDTHLHNETHVHGNTYMKGSVRFDEPSLFQNAVTFQKRVAAEQDTFLHQAYIDTLICLENPSLLHEIHVSRLNGSNADFIQMTCAEMTLQNQATFQDFVLFQKDVRIEKQIEGGHLHIHDSAVIDSNVDVKGESSFYGNARFLNTVVFAALQEFDQPVRFNDDITCETLLYLDSNARIIGRNNNAIRFPHVELTDTSIHVGSYLTLDHLTGIQIGPFHIDDTRVDFRGISQNDSNISLYYPTSCFDKFVCRDDLVISSSGSFRCRGTSRFDDHVFFEKEIFGSSLAFSNVQSAHLRIPRGISVSTHDDRFACHAKATFEEQATFCNSVHVYAPCDFYREPVRFHKGIHAHQSNTFDSTETQVGYINDATIFSLEIENRILQKRGETVLHHLISDTIETPRAECRNLISTSLKVDECTSTRCTSSNGHFDALFIEDGAFTYMNGQEAVIKTLHVPDHVYVRNVEGSNVSIRDMSVYHGDFSEWEGDTGKINTLYLRDGYLSNVNCQDMQTSNMYVVDLNVDNVQVSTLRNVAFIGVGEIDVETLHVLDRASISRLNTTETHTDTAFLNIIKNERLASASVVASNMHVDDGFLFNMSVSNGNINDLSACNVVFQNATVRSNMTIENDLFIANKIHGQEMEMQQKAIFQDVDIKGDLIFFGDRAFFGNKASFTTIDDVLSMTLQNDIEIGRYLYTQHIYFVLGFKSDVSMTKSATDDRIVIPFHIEKEKQGRWGLSHDLQKGFLRCSQDGIYVFDMYIEEKTEPKLTGRFGLQLDDNDPENMAITLSNIKFDQNRNTSSSFTKHAHFESFVSKDKYIYVIGQCVSDKDIESTNHFDARYSYMTVYMQNAY